MKTEYPSYGNYVPIMSSDIDGRFPAVIYESKATRVKVVVLQVDGPLVNGYMTVGKKVPNETNRQLLFFINYHNALFEMNLR